MRLTFKTLTGSSFHVVLESMNISVHDVKQITVIGQNLQIDNIRLFFNGTQLDDKFTLDDYGVHDEDILIYLIINRKIPQEEDARDQSLHVEEEEVKENQEDNKEYHETKTVLMEMGYTEEDSERALKSVQGNLSLAIEFLKNPPNEDNVIEEESQEQVEENQSEDLLKNIASIVKVLCQNNPSEIQSVVANLNESHPEMIDLLTENEQEFKNLISQPVTNEDIIVYKKFLGQDIENEEENAKENEEEEDQNNEATPENTNDTTEINLTRVDYDAVQRLKSLGFHEIDACQAYFAFDKNEDLAAEFLYENKLIENDDECLLINCGEKNNEDRPNE